jgi:hypothetical protein
MSPKEWRIYLGRIPHNETGTFWVSFESDSRLSRNKANIYGRCLPCIQHLYDQLKAGKSAIELGTAYHCWKITAVLEGLDQCLALLSEYERQFPGGHVYGKLGSGRTDTPTRVVVFHADDETERDRLDSAIRQCLATMAAKAEVLISRGCAVLYEPILGKWDTWQQSTPIRFPERVPVHIERLKTIMTTGKM